MTHAASRRNFDPSLFPRILGLLQRASCFNPRTNQQSLWTPESIPTASFTAFQERSS